MNKELKALDDELTKHMQVMQLLHTRVESLETQLGDARVQIVALMSVLRAAVQSVPSETKEEMTLMLERVLAQMSVQPGILLGDAQKAFRQAQDHIDWLIAPGQLPD